MERFVQTFRTFRDLPQWIRDNKEKLEGKKVLTYCTGGIRCEKFSGWLVREGFEDVGQLHGGIVSYGKDPGCERAVMGRTMLCIR